MMSFLTPTAFALAALLPIVVAMYFLKLRRADRLVSSIYLWQRLVRDYEANAPWQRLRRNLLLLLQLLFLTTLILALARPFTPTPGAAGQSLILLVDTSASMAATDVAPSRLDVAKGRAATLIDSLPDSARVTVIAAGHTPQVLVSNTQDRRPARNAIDSLHIQPGTSDLATALVLAGAVAARQTQAEIVILSDGRVALDPTEVPAAVRYIPMGEHGNNQAVSALSLRELAAGQAVSLFAQAANHGPKTVTRRLDIYVDGQLFDAREITIPAGDTAEIIQDNLPATTHQVEVRLADTDGLALDDRAWAVRTTGEPAPVLLVSEGNLFLETALSLLPNIELTIITPADYAAPSEEADTQYAVRNTQLTIFDRTVPPPRQGSEQAAFLPTNAFFIAPPAATAWFTPTGTIDSSHFTLRNSQFTLHTDPLMRYVDLTGLQILEALAIPLPEWGRPLVTTADGPLPGWPLLFAGEVDGRRVAVLAFDLRNSDLVLRPAFPLLMSNLIDYLAPGARGLVPTQILAGEPVALTVPPEVDEITVTFPDGRQATVTPERGRLTFADTEMPGVYHLALQSQGEPIAQSSFAVNMFSPAESSIAPRATLPIASSVTGQVGESAQTRGRRELWRPLALAAFIVLLIEWLIYQRAGLMQLGHRISVRITHYASRFTHCILLLTLGTLLISCSLIRRPQPSPTPRAPAPTATASPITGSVAPIPEVDDTGAEVATIVPDAKLTETYRNEIAGYAFDYPAGWLIEGEGEYVSLQNYRSEDLPPRVVHDPALYKIEFVWIRPGQARTVGQMLAQMGDALDGPPTNIAPNGLTGVHVRVRGFGQDVSDVLLLELNARVLLIQSWRGGQFFDRITATLRPIAGAGQ